MSTLDQTEKNILALQGEFFKAVGIASLETQKTLSKAEMISITHNINEELVKKGYPAQDIKAARELFMAQL